MGFLSRFLKKKPASTRAPQFAGHLYPEDPATLTSRIEQLISPPDDTNAVAGKKLKALIVPFAELSYCGDIMGKCWGHVQAQEQTPKHVALLGSGLRIPFQGVAMSTSEAWTSPLGTELWTDEVWKMQLEHLEVVRPIEEVHTHEPALEVQLPFVENVLGEEVTILPMLMGDGRTEDLEQLLEILQMREHGLIIIATELAYGAEVEEGTELMQDAIDAIESLEYEKIRRKMVTARHPVRALLKLARKEGWSVQNLGTSRSDELQRERNEQLTVQDQGFMTGYAGFAFYA